MNKVYGYIMRIPPKYRKKAAIMLLAIILLVFVTGVVALAMRDAILKSVVERGISKAKREYNLNVKIKEAKFSGLTTLVFDEVSVVPQERDSLAYVKSLRIGIRFIPLIFGNVKLSELKISDARINLIKKDSISNYDFLFKQTSTDTLKAESSLNLAEFVNGLLNNLLNKIPENLDIQNFHLSFIEDGNCVTFNTSSAIIEDGDVKSTIFVNDKESIWHVQGSVNQDERQFDLTLSADGKKVEIPFIDKKYNLKINFDKVRAQMNSVDMGRGELSIIGNCSIENLLFNHTDVAANDIFLPKGSLNAKLIIGENFIALDSSSVIHLKNIEANPYLKYTVSPSKTYALKLRTNEVDAQELFDSFPQGMFESLEGIKVSGKLKYAMNFFLDSEKPNEVVFDSGFERKDFKIVSFGKTNLQKINGTFIHTPFEYGRPTRSIVIGPENPNYVSSENISPDLINAVMTAEDPSFFGHRGFVMQAFSNSITANFKANSFKRGGSTISMQLVKNVYLNRQKTLVRKLEEILIVWLIENNRLSSKSRMLEVYLNLIEWGRNVYGINEASHYYFDKHPSQLSLGESIFLANIVPRPKSSLYFFESDGSLRASLKDYFNFVGGVMARRGYAAADTANSYGFYSVRLKESLRSQIVPLDFLINDPLMMNDEMEEDRKILEDILKKTSDTIKIQDIPNLKVKPQDTLRTSADIRRERRESRRQERIK
jgi:hypothetical protein